MNFLLTPNTPIAVQIERGILLGYLVTALTFWLILPSKIIPGPIAVLEGSQSYGVMVLELRSGRAFC